MDIMIWLNTLPGAVGQGFVWGIMALGLYITFKILDFADLTVDGSICTGAAVCTVLMTLGYNVWFAMLAALIAGALAGLITGLLHTKLGIPAILSGILTQLMLWSVNLIIMSGKANIALSGFKFRDKLLISSGSINISKTLIVLFVIIMILISVLYWFFGTQFGISLRSTGNSKYMSRAQGINTSFTTVFGLALSNAIVAFSGSLLAQQQGAADINMGRGAIVIGLAAVIVGESIITRISNNFYVRLIGVILGAVIYWIVFQTVIFLGLPSEYLKMLSAMVVAVFLGIPHIRDKKKQNSGRTKNA